jgi:hypothetical protein
MSVALPYRTTLGGLSSECLSAGFLIGMGPLEQTASQKWSHEGLVNKQLLTPSTHRASLWVGNELFSCWDCQFLLAAGSSKAMQYLAFPTGAAELLYSWMRFFNAVLPLPPRQRGNIPLCIWTLVLFRGCAVSSSGMLEYVVPSQTVYCTHLVD